MMMRPVVGTAVILFIAGVTCSPIDIPKPSSELLPPLEDDAPIFAPESHTSKGDDIEAPATDLIPPEVEESENLPTLATDLVPPSIDGPKDRWATPVTERNISATLFLINIYSIKNETADDSNDVLHDDVFQEVPDGVVEPLAMFLLIVEDKDEDHPVSLDEVAKDLEAEGFVVEKIERDGETRLVKVDIGSAETMANVDEEERAMSNAIERVGRELEEKKDQEESTSSDENSGKLMKFRRKREACLKCKLEQIKAYKHHGGGCQGGCGGGGGYYPPVQYQPVQVVPVQPVQPIYGGHGGGGYYPQPQPRPQPYYPQQPCNTCGGQHQGGGNAYAQASAQASASANSW